MRARLLVVFVCLSALALLTAATPAAAQFYAQHNLVSDRAGQAALVDESLVNAWVSRPAPRVPGGSPTTELILQRSTTAAPERKSR